MHVSLDRLGKHLALMPRVVQLELGRLPGPVRAGDGACVCDSVKVSRCVRERDQSGSVYVRVCAVPFAFPSARIS